MKVFVSSVVRDFEHFRDVAARAARSLGHEVKRSEDFSAMSASPQEVCLAGVRWADVVLLLLGREYGQLLPSGLSATHEEYREARERRPVLAFIQAGVDREPPEQAFMDEVRQWQGGRVTADFSTVDDLQDAVVRALHEYEMSQRAGEEDETEMLARARQLLPSTRGFATTDLCLVVVGGPRQPVLRPRDLDNPGLEKDVLTETLVGTNAVLSTKKGTDSGRIGNALTVEQEGRGVYVDEFGSVRVVQPAREEVRQPYGGLPVLIEEDVSTRLARSIRLAGWLLDRVDPLRRLSAVLPLVAIRGGSYLGWRSREEHARSPNQTEARISGSEPEPVALSSPVVPRAALLHSTEGIVGDFVSLLRRTLRT